VTTILLFLHNDDNSGSSWKYHNDEKLADHGLLTASLDTETCEQDRCNSVANAQREGRPCAWFRNVRDKSKTLRLRSSIAGLTKSFHVLRGGGPSGTIFRARQAAEATTKMEEEGLEDEGRGSAYQRLKNARARQKALRAEAEAPLRDQHEHIREQQKMEFFQIESFETPSTSDPEGEAKYPRNPYRRLNWTDVWMHALPNKSWVGDETFGQEWWRTAYRSWDWDPRNPEFWERGRPKAEHTDWVAPFEKYTVGDRQWYNRAYAIEAPGIPLDNPHMEVPSDWKRLTLTYLVHIFGDYAYNKGFIEAILQLDDPRIPPHVYDAVKAKRRVLVLGCANNDFCLEMYKDGYGSVVGVDWSEEAIRQQRMYHFNSTLYPGLRYDCMDVITWKEPENCVMVPPFNESDRLQWERKILDYKIPPYQNYSCVPEELGKFDLIIDQGCFQDVYFSGVPKVHSMLKHVSRVLKPEGVYLVWSTVPPCLELNPLSHVGYGWSIRCHPIQHRDDETEMHSLYNHSTLLYACTKHREDGTRVLASGELADDNSEDLRHGFEPEDYLRNSTLPDGSPREIDQFEVYSRLAPKFGWKSVEEYSKRIKERERAELEKRRAERQQRLEEEKKKNILKMAQDYKKRKEMEDRGLDYEPQSEDKGERSHTSVETEEYKELLRADYDPLDGFDPTQLNDDGEDVDDISELAKPRKLWEEVDAGDYDEEMLLDASKEGDIEELEQRLAQTELDLLNAGARDDENMKAMGLEKPISYLPPQLESERQHKATGATMASQTRPFAPSQAPAQQQQQQQQAVDSQHEGNSAPDAD